jgi:hypothetical protein
MSGQVRTRPAERRVTIPCGDRWLAGTLTVPERATAVAVLADDGTEFVHAFQAAGLATLWLGPVDGADVESLAVDHQTAADWLGRGPVTRGLRLGLFGVGPAAGAVLIAAARRPRPVGAVVCLNAPPDLAREHLAAVRAPALLIDDEGGGGAVARQAVDWFRRHLAPPRSTGSESPPHSGCGQAAHPAFVPSQGES